MYRIDSTTAASALPTPSTTGAEGFFTQGSATAGTPATIVTADFLNMMQEEIRAVVVAGGITPSKTVFNQLLSAISAMDNMSAPVVGSARNLKISITAASSAATITADEIILETALGGAPIRVANFSRSIGLTGTGATGMDTGSAPVSGYVGIYAIYNPTTGQTSTLAVNASAAVANVYSGANMPSGYTASALLSVWPTNASGQLVIGYQVDRTIYIVRSTAFSTAVQQASLTGVFIAGVIPASAREVFGDVQISSSASASLVSAVTGSSNGVGATYQSVTTTNTQGSYRAPLVNPQTIYYIATASTGTMGFNIYVTGYTI